MNKTPDMNLLNLSELVREITIEWVPHALLKRIDLGYEGHDKAIMIEGDRLRIKMLTDNLLDNAIRYSPLGSCVTIKVGTAGGSAVLSVEDNGPGIPKEERKAVFQRFYRILGSSGDGSGLGLSIVQEIAAAHGARVSIEDPEGPQGTLVKVLFPTVIS